MQKQRIVAIALISIILSSSSFSVADAYTIWSDTSYDNSQLSNNNPSKIYKIKLYDKTDVSLNNKFPAVPNPYHINMFDGISASINDNVYNTSIPYQIQLSDGILSVLANDDKHTTVQPINYVPKIISIGLADGIGSNSIDYADNSNIFLIKHADERKALWERIFPLDKIRNNIKSFYKIIQNDHSLSYIQMDEIGSKSYDYYLKQASNTETELEQLSDFEKFLGKSWYISEQIGIRVQQYADVDKFIGKSDFVGLQLVEYTKRLADPQNFVEKSKFVGQQITIQVYQIVDPHNPTLLVILIPLVGLVLIRTENDKFKFYNIQKIVSLIFAIILISSSVITPFSYSVLYWGNAFAEEDSTGNIGPPAESPVDQIVETVTDVIEDIAEPPPVEPFIEEPPAEIVTEETPVDIPLELPPESAPVDEPIQNTADTTIEEPIQESITSSVNNYNNTFDENLILADDSSNQLQQYNTTQQTQYNQTISFHETFSLIDLISLNNQTQYNHTISFDETILLTDSITSPDIPHNQSELFPEYLSFIDDIILLLQNKTTSLPNATESWQFENDTSDVTFNDDAEIDYTEGINGTSLLLDGQLDYAQANTTNATTYITDMSIAAWVKPNYTNGSPEFTVVSKGKSFVLSVNNLIEPQHVAKFAVFDGIKWTTVESTSTIPYDSWSHITARFNKTSIALYVNGTLEGTVTHGGVPYVSEKGQIELKTLQEITSYHDIVIGASLTPNMGDRPFNMFSGMIDGVQLFDSRLEPEDIILLYQTTVPIKAPIPVPEPRTRPEPALRYRVIKGNDTLPVSVPVADLDDNINELTVSTWIKPNFTNGSPEFTVLSRENSFILSLNKIVPPEKIAKFAVYDGMMWHTVTGSTPIDGWTHVAAVINQTNILLYINGTLDGKLETGPPWTAGSTANVVIGAYENTNRGETQQSNYYSGEIGEAVVWEYAMVDREVEEEYWKNLLVYQSYDVQTMVINLQDSIKIDEYTSKPTDISIPDNSAQIESLSIIDNLILNLNGIPIILPQDSLTFYDKVALTLNQEQETPVNATVLPQTLAMLDSMYLKLNGTIYTYLEEGLLFSEDILLLLNNQTVSFSNSTSRLTHGIIEIGKPVDWTQTVILNETDSLENILLELPADAQNIQIQRTDENGTSAEIPEENLAIISPELEPVENEYDIPRQKDIVLDEVAREHNATHVVPLDLAAMKELKEIKQKDKPTMAVLINNTNIDTNVTENIIPQNDTQNEYTVKFQTPAPYAVEEDYSTETKFQKNVTVAHDSTLHYTDVRSYTDIPEYLVLHNTQFKLYWMINGSKVDVTQDQRFNVTFADANTNGVIDRMEWIVPQLSEQEFGVEADITIINVQSFPYVGGNWTVYFNTTGTADLIIKGIAGTTFGNVLPNDLKFLELNNGTHTLTPIVNLTANTITYHNYTSNYIGFETSRVLTSGGHHLEFRFGNDVAYAHNSALIFQDNFNRADNNNVGNGWTELESAATHLAIGSNRLDFDSIDAANERPMIKHTFEKQNTGKLRLSYTFNFDLTNAAGEGTYEARMQLGDSGTMDDASSDTTGVAVNLIWGSTTKGLTNTEGFGTKDGAAVTQRAIVSGVGGANVGGDATITVDVDLDANTYDLTISGPGFISGAGKTTGIPFDNDVDIDEIRIFLDDLNDVNFGALELDNMSIEKVNGDIQIAVGRFALNAGVAPNTQSITGLGFEPKAYILMATKNDNNDQHSTAGEAAGFSMGATDGKNSWAIATQDEDEVGTSDSGRRAASGYVLLNIDENPNNSEEAAGIASHVSFDPDGFTIHIQDDFDEDDGQLVEYIAFGGEGIHPAVGDVILDSTNGNAVSVSGLDFEPDLLITGFVGPWIGGRDDPLQEAMMMSLGWAVNPDIQAANNQFSMSIGSQDAQTDADSFSRFDTAWAGVAMEDDGNLDSSFEITGFYDDGFSVTTRQENTGTNPRFGFGYLALDLGDSPEIYTTSRDARTVSAGLDIESGAGFMPIFLLGAGSAEVDSTEVNSVEDDASLAIGITNGTHSYSLSMRSEDGPPDTNTATRTREFPAFLEAYPDNSDTENYIADFDSFTGDGWILDYTDEASTDFQIAFLAIGDNYQRSVPDKIDFMQPDAAAPGMNVAVSFYGHNFNNTQQVTTSSNNIMVGPVYVFNEAGENVTSGGSILTTTFFVAANAPAETVTVTIDGTNVIPKFEIIPITGPLVGSGDYSGFAPCPCPTFTLGDDNGINGNRTKLGTIILDDLKVPSGMTLIINVTDLDDSTPANEGFLPAVILVQGDVDIDGTINISGSNGADGSDDGAAVLSGGDGGDGGPGGGGGGGGAVTDDNGGANDGSGGDGGDGYTGGGGGGCSDNEANSIAGTGGIGTGGSPVAGTNNCEATHGAGGFFANYTGGTGGGLNTLDASNNDAAGGGGGTGFVFGSSGKGGIGEGTANGLGSGAAGDGGGGGGDSGDNYAGGGGGFGQVGDRGENDNGNVHGGYGGRVYGNEWLVPVSGGSGGGGGGSDDDDATGDSAGGGGGGGGAIIIYGQGSFLVSATGSIDATGGNGGAISSDTDDNGEGGGGSGGAIILQGHAVVDTQNGDLDANGGVGGDNGGADQGGNGGDGRVRVDGLRLGATAVEGLAGGFSGSDYVGPAISGINILTGVASGVYLNGTGKNDANVTAVIINDNNGDKVADYTDYYNYKPIFSNGEFGFLVTFREGDNFITIIQNTTNNNSVLSSAATHIVFKRTMTDSASSWDYAILVMHVRDETASVDDIVVKAPVTMRPFDVSSVDDKISFKVTKIIVDSASSWDYAILVMHVRDETASVDDIIVKAPATMRPFDVSSVDDKISFKVTKGIIDSASVDDVIAWTLTRRVQDDLASVDDIVVKAPVTMRPFDVSSVDDKISFKVTKGIIDSASVDDVIAWTLTRRVQDDLASVDDIVVKAPVTMRPFDVSSVDDKISFKVTKIIADSASVDDVIRYSFVVFIDDETASVDDIVVKAPVTMRPFDVSSVDDKISFKVTKIIADSASVDDVIAWTLTRRVQDDLASVDDIVVKAPVTMRPFDVSSVDDKISFKVTKIIADSASVDDVIRYSFVVFIDDETASVDDIVVKAPVTMRPFDVSSVDDKISFKVTKGIIDSATVDDVIASQIIQTIHDSAIITDNITLTLTRLISDSVLVDDTISFSATMRMDDLVQTDDEIIAIQLGLFKRELYDSSSSADILSAQVSKQLLDFVTIQDNLSINLIFSISDSSLLEDSITIKLIRTMFDEAFTDDTASLIMISRIKDSASVEDVLRPTTITMLEDSATISDTIQVISGKLIFDSATVSDTLHATTTKVLHDSASVEDVLRPTTITMLEDSATISDTIQVISGKLIFDSATVSDTLHATTTKVLHDSASVEDVLRPTTITMLEDSATISDTIQVISGKLIFDSATVSDTLHATTTKVLHDSASVEDVLRPTTITMLEDSATISDTIQVISGKLIFDSATVSDTLHATTTKVLHDSALVQDDITKIVFTIIRDNVSVDDNIRVTFGKMIFDSGTVSDSLTKTVYYRPRDSASVQDDITKITFSLQSDHVSVDDNIRVTFGKMIFDSGTVSDSLTKTVYYRPRDSASVQDDITKITFSLQSDHVSVDDNIRVTFGKMIFDSGTVSDSLTKTVYYRPRDSVSIQDILSKQVFIILRDNVVVNDIIRLTFGTPIFDSGTVSDSLTKTVYYRPRDSVSIQDILSKQVFIILRDNIVVNDIIRLTFGTPIFDSGTVSDSLTKTVYYRPRDSVSIQDILSKQVFIILRDNIVVNDIIRLTFGTPIFDSGTVHDTIYKHVTYRLQDTVLLEDILLFKFVNLLDDSATIDDVIRITLGKPLFDSATVSDVLQATTTKVLHDSAQVHDDITKIVFTILRDHVSVDDILRITLSKPLFDSATVHEIISKHVTYRISDTVSAQDISSKRVTIVIDDEIGLVDDLITISPVTYRPNDMSRIDDIIQKTVTYRISDTVSSQDISSKRVTIVIDDEIGLVDDLITISPVTYRPNDMSRIDDIIQKTVTYRISDSVLADEQIKSRTTKLIADTALVEERISVRIIKSLKDSASVEDILRFQTISILQDTATIQDIIFPIITRVIESDSVAIDDNINWVRIKTITDTSSVVDSINLILTIIPPPPPPPPPIPFGQGRVLVGTSPGAGGAPDMPTAKIHRVEYDVCNENIARILATHDGSSAPRIQLLTTKLGIVDATLVSDQPYAEQNRFTLVDRYLFEAPLAPGESVFTIFAVDSHSNVQRTLVQIEGCTGTLVFADDQIVLPHIFDVKYKTNGTDIRPTEYHYISEGQDMTVSAIVASPIVPLAKAELFFTILGTGQQKVIPMDVSPLTLPDLENISTIYGMIPADMLKGPAVEFWIRIVTQEGIVQESVHHIVGVKPEGYSGTSSVEMDTITIKAQGTTLKPTAYLTNEGDIPVYGAVSLVADGKQVYSKPVLLTPGQNIINLEWSIPKSGDTASYKIQTLLEVYDVSYITGMATLDTFARTKVAQISSQSEIVPATDKLGNIIARPAMMYSSNDDTGSFRVVAPDGTCVIGSGCLVEQSTLKHRGGIDSVLIDGHIYRVRYSGDDSPLERFSITSLDSVLGQWNVQIVDLGYGEFVASAAEDTPIKVQYRAEDSPLVTVGME